MYIKMPVSTLKKHDGRKTRPDSESALNSAPEKPIVKVPSSRVAKFAHGGMYGSTLKGVYVP